MLDTRWLASEECEHTLFCTV